MPGKIILKEIGRQMKILPGQLGLSELRPAWARGQTGKPMPASTGRIGKGEI
jgi:hypothetical protein